MTTSQGHAGVFERLVAAVRFQAQRHQARAILMQLNDDRLRDIGLTRGDVLCGDLRRR